MELLLDEQGMMKARDLGGKAKRLWSLKRLGARVPDFVVAHGAIAVSENDHQSECSRMAREAHRILKAESYAVRSCALIEDADSDSHAGQFMTRLDIAPEGIADAMIEVFADAKAKLSGKLTGFSIIIQTFVRPDAAGVVFSRNPMGGAEMVWEWTRGWGEKVVGGEVKPERLSIGRHEATPEFLPNVEKAIALVQQCEQDLGGPQDMEWCVRGEEWFFVQTRPITTLSAEDIRGIALIDNGMAGTEPHFFEKTDACELALRPTTLVLEMLRALYLPGGPVDRVYRSLDIAFTPGEMLRVFGNELFMDREAEVRALFPAMSLIASPSAQPKLVRWSGAWRTLKNISTLSKVAVPSTDALADELRRALARPLRSGWHGGICGFSLGV